MPEMRSLALLAALLLILPGCKPDDDKDTTAADEALTCEVLSDPGNCWAAAAAEVADCIPDGEIGVLDPDRAFCSYNDGTRVVFETPLPNDTTMLERLAFTVERNGSTCAQFVDTFENRMELKAGSLGAVSELHPGSEFHLHCDDGPTYKAEFSLLFDCPPGTAPTDGFSVQPHLVTFTLSSVATPSELFRCVLVDSAP
jgi:hypothetical protein